jgi:hypothetical protein
MKKIIVTAAGREEYLSILLKYMVHAKKENEFDEWHLWHNTEVQSDIDYIYNLEKEYDFIKVLPFPDKETIVKTCFCDGAIYADGKMVYAHTIKYFYPIDGVNEDSLYLKLDDDIVFIKKQSIQKIFNYRLKDTEHFLVYGNTINNVAMANIHQNIGVLPSDMGKVSFSPIDKLGLYSGDFVKFTHNNFFEKYDAGLLDQYNFEPLVIEDYVPVAIQAISWRGEDYSKFEGKIPPNEHDEVFQAQARPKIEGRKNIIVGDTLFVHYCATTTRPYMDNHRDILSRYDSISNEYLK